MTHNRECFEKVGQTLNNVISDEATGRFFFRKWFLINICENSRNNILGTYYTFYDECDSVSKYFHLQKC